MIRRLYPSHLTLNSVGAVATALGPRLQNGVIESLRFRPHSRLSSSPTRSSTA